MTPVDAPVAPPPLRSTWWSWRRAVDWLRRSPAGLLALALAVGVGAGLAAIGFRELIAGCTLLFSGHTDYAAAPGEPHPWLPWLGTGFLVLAPAAGGLLYGPLVDRFAREARGHGVPEVMLAVMTHGGRIRPRVAAVKSLASAVCIGSGGSVGREGPIVQIGSALGSTLGQAIGLSAPRLRLLVACGAAGGVSATFNAPIAGALFALELILRDIEAESFGVIVVSSVTANAIARAAFGSSPFMPLPPFELHSARELLLYAVLGVLAALVGVGFMRALYGMEDLADRVWRGPEWLRPVVGGLLLGVLLLGLPQMYGVGYPVMERAIGGGYGAWLLLLLLVGKVVATSLTIAIGGSGGVFAPSLFMGAMLGMAFGHAANALFPDVAVQPGAYGLVGMGAVFAGAARAPITATVIVFELTNEYLTIPPLLLSVGLAAALSAALSRDTIYTLKLRRRGIEYGGRPLEGLALLEVAQAMEPTPDPLRADATLRQAIDRFAAERWEALPVVDAQGAYLGTVTAAHVEQAAREGPPDAPLGPVAQPTPTARVGERLRGTLAALVTQELKGMPVLSPDGRQVVGWLTHRGVLEAYRRRLETPVSRLDLEPAME